MASDQLGDTARATELNLSATPWRNRQENLAWRKQDTTLSALETYAFVCVCVCVCARVCACARVCTQACMRVQAHMRESASVWAHVCVYALRIASMDKIFTLQIL